MKKYKIVYDETIVDDLTVEREYLVEHGLENFELVKLSSEDEEKFMEEAVDADGICAFLPFDKEKFARLRQCKVVAAPALGVDFFDLAAASEHGIYICNVPNYCIEEVATHTVALVLDSCRRISRQDRYLRTGAWDWQEKGKLHRLRGQNYGLISFGNISRRVAEMMRGFGMNIVAYDPFVSDDVFEKYTVRRADSIEEIFSECHVISVHTPLNKHTYHLISDDQFSYIPESAVLVVTSRGGIVDEEALKRAIEEGKVSSVGLDVIEDEITFQSVLRDLPEVTITPHIAFYTEESERELRVTNIAQIVDVLERKKRPEFVVNEL